MEELPSFDEWKLAAYKQVLPSKVFQLNKIHKYPSGDKAEKMNSQGLLGYNRHMDVTKLPEGIMDWLPWAEMFGNGFMIARVEIH